MLPASERPAGAARLGEEVRPPASANFHGTQSKPVLSFRNLHRTLVSGACFDQPRAFAGARCLGWLRVGLSPVLREALAQAPGARAHHASGCLAAAGGKRVGGRLGWLPFPVCCRLLGRDRHAVDSSNVFGKIVPLLLSFNRRWQPWTRRVGQWDFGWGNLEFRGFSTHESDPGPVSIWTWLTFQG